MTLLRASPSGKLLLTAPSGKRLLYKPLRAGAVAPPAASSGWTGTLPSAVSGLSGWWDAGNPVNLLAGGGALSDFGPGVTGASDLSGGGNPLSVFHYASSGTVAPAAVPRCAGLLGGLGASTVTPPAVPASGYYLPQLEPDNGLKLAACQMGSGAAWTRYLVWTRPNLRQGYGLTGAVALLTAGSTVVLAADSTASPSRLILFPGASQTVLTAALERRHTHSVVIRNTPGTGVDVWLDGAQVASAAPNPLAASATAALLLLHSGAASGGAQCWFHEAATWERALSSADVATLLSCATRWPRGARKGVSVGPIGQSNAGNAINDGAWHMLAQGIAWHLGVAAWNVIGKYGSSGSSTCIGGHGLYTNPSSPEATFAGTFLTYAAGAPSTWALGADGMGVETFYSGQTAADLADLAALVFPWSESDSVRAYSEEATETAAYGQFVALIRSYLGKTAAQLPALTWNAIPFPYSNNGGMQMMRETEAAMAASSGLNMVLAMPQTSDSNARGATWNAQTGAQSGGDVLHRDAPDNVAFGQRAAVVAARAILAAGGADTLASIPSGLPVVGGPKIASAHLSGSTVTVTVTHDAGTDLVVPLMAAAGAGWAVMDGGSVASPGPIIAATACARASATTLTLTLASKPSNPGPSCLLFYPYGYAQIGRGNAVTDNFASLPKPAGWDIGHDLGSSWNFNWPLQATTTPVAMS